MKKIILSLSVFALVLLNINSAKADAGEVAKGIGGVVVGAPVGFVFGGSRGLVSKATEYADTFPEALGDGAVSKVFGTVGGIFVGGILGGATGIVKGTVNGVLNGYKDPFSTESMSADGDFLEYNPYDFSF